MLEGIGSQEQAHRALEEIERLMRDAAAAGVRLDPWIGELAEELRAAWPEIDIAGAAALAARVAAKPTISLAAQAKGKALRAVLSH